MHRWCADRKARSRGHEKGCCLLIAYLLNKSVIFPERDRYIGTDRANGETLEPGCGSAPIQQYDVLGESRSQPALQDGRPSSQYGRIAALEAHAVDKNPGSGGTLRFRTQFRYL